MLGISTSSKEAGLVLGIAGPLLVVLSKGQSGCIWPFSSTAVGIVWERRVAGREGASARLSFSLLRKLRIRRGEVTPVLGNPVDDGPFEVRSAVLEESKANLPSRLDLLSSSSKGVKCMCGWCGRCWSCWNDSSTLYNGVDGKHGSDFFLNRPPKLFHFVRCDLSFSGRFELLLLPLFTVDVDSGDLHVLRKSSTSAVCTTGRGVWHGLPRAIPIISALSEP